MIVNILRATSRFNQSSGGLRPGNTKIEMYLLPAKAGIIKIWMYSNIQVLPKKGITKALI